MWESELRVAVAGGRAFDRACLMAFIASLPGLRVTELDAHPAPDVLVWDARDRIQEVCDALSDLPDRPGLVVVVSGEVRLDQARCADSLFSTDDAPASLGIAIRQAARREQYLSPDLVRILIQRQQTEAASMSNKLHADAEQLLRTLTAREREILTLLAEGLSNKAIAARLYLSVRTVEGHLAHVYEQLGVHSRTEAALIAVRSGLASPGPSRSDATLTS